MTFNWTVRSALEAALVVAVAVSFTGCGSKPPAGEKGSTAAAKKVLTYAIGNDISNMDPSLINDIESALVASHVYEGLVKFKADSVEIEPALAEKYEVSPDGLKWTFTLREGVKFHDGSPLTADVVKFSITRQMEPHHPFHVAGRMRYAKMLFGDPSTTETELVRDITTPDERTVVFELARPFTPFIKNLAMTPAAIVSRQSVEAMSEDFNTTMVGTGPFRLKSYRAESMATLVRNDGYWGDKALLDEARIRIVRDATVRINSLRKGDSDAISGVEPTAVPLLEKEADITVLSEPSINLGYISMNCAVAPFDNPKVRLAMNHAIDKKYIVDNLFSGTSVIATGVIPPGMLGHDPSREPYPHDPEKARQLLAEAGYPNGFTINFSTHDRPRVYYPVGSKLAERLQQDLAAVGVTAKIDMMEFPTFLSKVKSRDYQMANSGWVTDNGDPDNFIYELVGRPDNEMNYQNEEASRLMRQAAGERDDEARARLYKQAEDLVYANPPMIFLNNAKQVLAVRKRVKNFKLHPTAVTQLQGVDVEP